MSFNQSLNLFNQQKQTSNDNFLDCVKAKCLPPLNPQNGKTLKNYYKQISISKEEKRKDFSKNKWFVNKQNGQILKMKNIELYKMLLNHMENEIIEVFKSSNRYNFEVTILAKNKSYYKFQWIVEKYHEKGPLQDCWLTTVVTNPIPLGSSI